MGQASALGEIYVELLPLLRLGSQLVLPQVDILLGLLEVRDSLAKLEHSEREPYGELLHLA